MAKYKWKSRKFKKCYLNHINLENVGLSSVRPSGITPLYVDNFHTLGETRADMVESARAYLESITILNRPGELSNEQV